MKAAKCSILHDYDLHANLEPSSQGVTCAVCGTSPTRFQWSDYSGEGMCTACGCTYQLKWGSKEQQAEGKYPYMTMTDDFLPIAREYWEQTHKWVCYGTMLGGQLGMAELIAWCKEYHPECLTRKEPHESPNPKNG